MPSAGLYLADPVTVLPSRLLCVWVVTVSAFAIMLCAIFLPAAAALVMCIILAGMAVSSIRRDGLLVASDAVVSLRFGPQGLHYQCSNGVWHEAVTGTASTSGFVSPWVVLVAMRSSGTRLRKYILLFPDSLQPDAARRMRLWLRWSREAVGDR